MHKVLLCFWIVKRVQMNKGGNEVIRVELMGKKNQHDNCVLDINNKGIIYIVCKNAEQKQALMDLVIHYFKKHNKKVDVIDIDKIDSDLCVRNYLVFYTMVMGVYENDTIQEFTTLFQQIGMDRILDKPINELNKLEKIKVRSIAAYVKKSECLVGKDLLGEFNVEQQEDIITFFEKYLKKSQCLCLLFESRKLQREEDVDAVFVV